MICFSPQYKWYYTIYSFLSLGYLLNIISGKDMFFECHCGFTLTVCHSSLLIYWRISPSCNWRTAFFSCGSQTPEAGSQWPCFLIFMPLCRPLLHWTELLPVPANIEEVIGRFLQLSPCSPGSISGESQEPCCHGDIQADLWRSLCGAVLRLLATTSASNLSL